MTQEESGNGNNGTVNSDVTLTTADRFGNENSAYSLDGNSDEYIEIPWSSQLAFGLPPQTGNTLF